MVGVTEALNRLRSNWSPGLHEGENAVVSLPRPDVIAAYHRNDPPPVEVVDPNSSGGEPVDVRV